MRYPLAIFALAIGCSMPAWAESSKEDLAYVNLRLTDLEYRAVENGRHARAHGAEVVLGSYLTDYIRVEGRLGTSLEEASRNALDINLKGYASLYFGIQYPVIEYLTAYGLFGFTVAKGEADHDGSKAFQKIPDKFFNNSFSPSYALGLDYHITGGWHANLELGQIHRDSTSNVRTMQWGLGVKYEY